MKEMGMWSGDVKPVRKPMVADAEDDVAFLNSSAAGIFISEAKHGDYLHKGELVGKVVDPLHGSVLASMISPMDGILFTIREYPVVDEGSLIARILKAGYQEDINEN